MLNSRTTPRTSEQLSMAATAGIHFPTTLPLFNNPPDDKVANTWVNCHTLPEVKAIARKLVNNINYISFARFFAQLQDTVAHFNNEVTEPYVLWIPQDGTRSDKWVASLALEHTELRWPDEIVVGRELLAFLNSHPNITHVLLLDDASYTASHILTELGNLWLHNGYQPLQHCFYVGIGFMTQIAEKRILNNTECPNIRLLRHESMLMVQDILSSEEQKYLDSMFGYKCTRETLTYFDHVAPDAISTLHNLFDGCNLLLGQAPRYMASLGFDYRDNKLVEEKLPSTSSLVPTVIRPYCLRDEKTQDKLKKAMQQKKMGSRSQYPAPADVKQALEQADIKLEESAPPSHQFLQNHGIFKPRVIITSTQLLKFSVKLHYRKGVILDVGDSQTPPTLNGCKALAARTN